MSGGAGKQLSLTANALAERGCEVTIYAFHWNNEPTFKLSKTVQFIPENNIVKRSLFEYIVIPFRIRSLIKLINPNVVIGWRSNAGYHVYFASMGLPVKTIFVERSDPYMEHSIKLSVAKHFCNCCDYGIFQTGKARDYYKIPIEHCAVIANPFSLNGNIEHPLPYETRNKEIIFAGRFNIKQKRQDIAVRAFALFYDKHPDYKLIFCGDGKDTARVQELVESLGLSNSVVFEGLVSDMKSRVSNSKLLILSSDYEGIPNVILEAFTWGLPVVTTDCSPGGARVLVDDGENGYIVPVRDYKAMAERMENLVDNDYIANKFIENGLRRLHNFAPKEIFDHWYEFVQSTIN